MIIAHLNGGLGNQMFQYAIARAAALRLDTELKLDRSTCDKSIVPHAVYKLDAFNITEHFATPDDIELVKSRNVAWRVTEADFGGEFFNPKALEIADDSYLVGYWQSEKYFADIADIIRQDFTLHDTHTHKGRRQRRGISKKFARQIVPFPCMFGAAIISSRISAENSA